MAVCNTNDLHQVKYLVFVRSLNRFLVFENTTFFLYKTHFRIQMLSLHQLWFFFRIFGQICFVISGESIAPEKLYSTLQLCMIALLKTSFIDLMHGSNSFRYFCITTKKKFRKFNCVTKTVTVFHEIFFKGYWIFCVSPLCYIDNSCLTNFILWRLQNLHFFLCCDSKNSKRFL